MIIKLVYKIMDNFVIILEIKFIVIFNKIIIIVYLQILEKLVINSEKVGISLMMVLIYLEINFYKLMGYIVIHKMV